MTSIPASRSALATTRAPRSWPSRPGLAMRTRILSSPGRRASPSPAAAASEHRRFAVGAEDLAHGRHGLAHGDVGMGALEERRHQVDLAAGGIAQLLQAALGARRVTGAPDLRHDGTALALCAHVDLEDRDLRAFLGLDVLVHAHHDLAVRLQLLLVAVGGAADLALLESLFDGRDDTAERLDLGEVILRLFLHA